MNTRLFNEKGIGTMRNMNSAISAIRSMNTCRTRACQRAVPLTTRTRASKALSRESETCVEAKHTRV